MRLSILALAASAILLAVPAKGDGELHIYNWGDYTSPKLIEKFTQAYDVDVRIDEYQSNDELVATLRTGNTGYDIAMPSEWGVQLLIEEGLLAETKPNQMPNFKNLHPRWIGVFWDPGRNYSVPYLWGTTGLAVDTAAYAGGVDSLKSIFDPPPELQGRIGILPESTDVINAALRFLGKPLCNNSHEDLEAVTELLVESKRHWRSIAYNQSDAMISGDVVLAFYWSNAVLGVRKEKPTMKYVYPREGFEVWADNVVVLKDAPNLENAKLFQDFMMDPEIAALNSDYNQAANAILGSDKFLPPEFTEAPEINLPGDAVPEFIPLCPREVRDKYDAIWAEVVK